MCVTCGTCDLQDISDYSRVYKTADQLRLGFATDNADTAQVGWLAWPWCVVAAV
jgi:hypothetical protein